MVPRTRRFLGWAVLGDMARLSMAGLVGLSR